MVLQHTPPTTKTYSKKINQNNPTSHTRQPSISVTIPSTPFHCSSQSSLSKPDDRRKVADYNENEDDEDEDEDDEDDEDDDTSQVNEEIVVSSQPSVEPNRPVTPRASSRISKSNAQKEMANAQTTPNPSLRKRTKSKQPDSDDSYSPTKKPRKRQQENPALLDTLLKQISSLTEQVSQLQQSRVTSVQPPSRPSSRASSRTENHQLPTHRLSFHSSGNHSRASSRSENHSRSSSIRYDDPVAFQPPTTIGKFLKPPPPLLASGNPNPFVQFTLPNPFTGTSITPNTLLHYWPWAETAQLTAIASGMFNFKELPKLLRDEDARQQYIDDSIKGINLDIETGNPKVLHKTLKLLSAFLNLQTFTSAFTTYASIRSTFDKEYGPVFYAFIEQLNYHALHAPWPNVLKYAANFFRTYQNAPPEAWYQFDNHLLRMHFTHATTQGNTSTTLLGTSSTNYAKNHIRSNYSNSLNNQKDSQSSRPQQKSTTPLHLQICIRYNREKCSTEKPCGRLHVCLLCGKPHPSTKCSNPSKPATTSE